MYRYDCQKASPTKIHCTVCLEMLPQFVKNCTNHHNQEACNFGNENYPLLCMVHSLLLGDSYQYGGEENTVSVESSNGASDDNAVRLDTLLKDFKAIQENHRILR